MRIVKTSPFVGVSGMDEPPPNFASSRNLKSKAIRGLESLKEIREIVPNHFLLVPGVGAQGGSLDEVAKYGSNDDCGLLVNSSRGIIYASDGENYATRAKEEAQKLQAQMSHYL